MLHKRYVKCVKKFHFNVFKAMQFIIASTYDEHDLKCIGISYVLP
jgi:hypothetical protein